MDAKEYISLARLTRLTGLPKPWLKAEAEAGRIPSLGIGQRRLFNFDAVMKALADCAAQNLELEGGDDG